MQKPRITRSPLAPGRWQCKGGPMKHGEHLSGYGDTPKDAWHAFLGGYFEHMVAEGDVVLHGGRATCRQ